jgi:hypothetical protein
MLATSMASPATVRPAWPGLTADIARFGLPPRIHA